MIQTIVIFFLLTSTSCWASKTEPFHIIVDPGHGGSDGGAVRGKYREADIALAVSKELVAILSKHSQFKTTLTRSTDETLTPPMRTKLARSIKADLFLSIHLNSSIDSKVHGTEFYFKNQLPPEEETLFLANIENQSDTDSLVDESPKKANSSLGYILDDLKSSYELVLSKKLAEELKKNWKNDHNTHNIHIRQGPFQVLLNVEMPSLLVELGFISNPKEAAWLSQPQTHKAIAQSLFKGIYELKEKIDKYRQSSHIANHAN